MEGRLEVHWVHQFTLRGESFVTTRWFRPGCHVVGWSGYLGVCREVRTGTSGY